MKKDSPKTVSQVYATRLFAALFLLTLVALSSYKEKVSFSLPWSEARQIAKQCAGFSNREQCYARAFGELTKQSSLEHSFQALESLQKVDDQAKGCHFIAHRIATEETRKNVSAWREIMNNRCPTSCSYGCQHGAIETHYTQAHFELDKNFISSICQGAKNSDCPHIVGHLLLVETARNIDRALELCEFFPAVNQQRKECFSGVFMEEQTVVNLAIHGLAEESELNWSSRVPELETLCRKFEDVRADACWREIVHAVVIRANNDPRGTYDFCTRAPRQESKYDCMQHATGVLAGSSKFSFDIERGAEICEAVPENNFFSVDNCRITLVLSTIYSVPKDAEKIMKYCAETGELREQCFANVKVALQGLGLYSEKTYNDLCEEINKNYRSECIDASTTKFFSRREGLSQ